MKQAGNIKGAYTAVQRNTENLKLPASGYYRVKPDGLDELPMRGLVWVYKSSMGWGRVCWKDCSRPCISGVCVSRVGLDSVGQGSGEWDRKGLLC